MKSFVWIGAVGVLAGTSVLVDACVIADDDLRGPCGGARCDFDLGECCVESCGGLDAADVCVERASPCSRVFSPVCGCDGVTYGNPCVAHATCVAIAYAGPCEGDCSYTEPEQGTCPAATVPCSVEGPELKCVAPDRFDRCCSAPSL